MTANTNSTSGGSGNRACASLFGRALYSAATLTLIVITWRWAGLSHTDFPPVLGVSRCVYRGVVSTLLYGLISAGSQRALASNGPMSAQPWTYRLGFLGSIALAVVRSGTLVADPTWMRWLPVFTGVPGGFLGGLLTSFRIQGLWEDNAPPPDYVKRALIKSHLQAGIPSSQPCSPKRIFDIAMASIGLILSAPVWIFLSFAIWFEDPGPLFFIKNSVGLGGITFHQFKFRTMIRGAEIKTGPIMARAVDERVLWVGRFMRKTALDELPQLWNIVRGEMSFVGPRPQRTVLVYAYLEVLPGFVERHRVRPGLAGLAQVAGSYYITPRQKLRYDRLYLRYASLGFDLKLIALAFLKVFWLRWRPGWDSRLPRRWIRFASPQARFPTA